MYLVKRENNEFITFLYHETNFSGLFTHFESFLLSIHLSK